MRTERKSIEADITFVMMDLRTQKLLPIEGEMKDLLTRELKL
jgi:acyl-CoA thioesterase FadM